MSLFSSTAQPLTSAEMSTSVLRINPSSGFKKKKISNSKNPSNDSLFEKNKNDSSTMRKPFVGKRKQVSFLDKYRARTSNQSVRASRLNYSRSQMSGIDTPPEADSQINEAEHLNIIQYVRYKFSEGSPLGTAITLTMSAAIGPGMLSLAYAVSMSGMALGIGQLLFCAFLGYFSLMLLTKTARLTGKYSYAEIADSLFGPGFAFFVKIIFFLNNWGAAIADIMLMNDMITGALAGFFPNIGDLFTDPNQNFFPIVLGTFVVFPLCLLRTLKGLRFVLLLAFSLTIYVTVIIIIKAITGYSTNITAVSNFIPTGVFTTLPIGFFAYTCHPNVLEAYEELDYKQTRRIRGVLSRTMITIFILYSLIGGLGYFSLAALNNYDGDLSSGNLLLAYPPPDFMVQAAILVFSLTMTIALPLGIKPVKDCLSEIINPNVKEDSTKMHFFLTFVTIVSIVVVSMFVKNMSTVVGFLGASTNSLICFNLPCLYYIKACKGTKNKGRMILAQVVNVSLFVFSAFSVGYMAYEDLTEEGGDSAGG